MKNKTLTKSIARFFLCLLAIGSIFSFAACTDDNDDGNNSGSVDSSLIYGTWKLKTVTYNGVEAPEYVNYLNAFTITFNSNGTYLTSFGDEVYAFSLSNNILTLQDTEGSTVETMKMSVEALTSTTLKVSFTGQMDEDMPAGNWSFTFEKGTNNLNNALLYGTWTGTTHVVDGETITHVISLTFNADGTGLLNDQGVTENNAFTYTVTGNVISVVPVPNVVIKYTITTLTSTSLIISGNSIPGEESGTSYIGYYTKTGK